MPDAQLAATVYVTDPDTHQTVALAAGTRPEDRLAALVTNPAAWTGRKAPNLPQAGQGPTGGGQDGASGGGSQDSEAADAKAAPAAKKTAARKSAAHKPARGRNAADQGDGGE